MGQIAKRPAEVQLTFDYEGHEINKTERRSLEAHANAITREVEKVRRTTVEGVFKIAERLQKAHDELANHKNGTFEAWVSQRCGITSRTARRMLQARRAFPSTGKYPDTVSGYFDASALYALSADSCPEEATEEALRLADAGERITKKRAGELIRQFSEVDDEDGFDLDSEQSKALDSLRRIVNRFPDTQRTAICELMVQLLEQIA